MDSMFFNKIAGAVLLTVLIGFAITEVSHVVVHPQETTEVAYPVPEMAAPAADGAMAAAEEAGPSIGVLLASGDAATGEKVFKKCAACHTINEGGKNGQGPNLFGILDRDIASTDGFGYSTVLEGMDGGWSYEALAGFLANPKKYAPKTKMQFVGLKKESELAGMILYLRSFGDADVPLPVAE